MNDNNNGVIRNSGQALAASATREQRLEQKVQNLKHHLISLSHALTCYRKQHDAGYLDGHCTCVNCVFVTSLIDTSEVLVKQ